MINYQATGEALTKGKIPVKLFPSSAAIFQAMARDMADTIKEHNAKGLATTFILPVGPVGQYPYFVDLVNQERISLKQCHFLNMDEYLTDSQEWIPASDPLSFRGAMRRDVFEKIDEELRIPASQWIFPDPKDLGKVPPMAASASTATSPSTRPRSIPAPPSLPSARPASSP